MENKKILVVGLGRLGRALAEALWESGVDVMVLDANEKTIEEIKSRSSAAFVGDSAQKEVLENLGIEKIDAAIVTYGESLEASVLTVATLKELGISQIVVRAATPRQADILKTVGATRTLEVEAEMGRRVANELFAPISEDLIEFAQNYRVIPWAASGPLMGKSLQEAKIFERFGIMVLGFRSGSSPVASGVRPRLRIPDLEYRINEGDTLMLVGEADNMNHFMEKVGGE